MIKTLIKRPPMKIAYICSGVRAGGAIFRSSSIYQSHVHRSFLLNRRFSTKEAEASLKVNDYSNKEYRKNLHGFNDALLERVAEIIVNMVETTFTRILQLYPENRFTSFLRKSSLFTIEGCSDAAEADREFEEKIRYASMTYTEMSSSARLPFNDHSYQAVVNCVPPLFTVADRHRVVPPKEIFRLLSGGALGLFGAPQDLWESLHMTQLLDEDDPNNGRNKFASNVKLVNLQKMSFAVEGKPEPVVYYLALVRKT